VSHLVHTNYQTLYLLTIFLPFKNTKHDWTDWNRERRRCKLLLIKLRVAPDACCLPHAVSKYIFTIEKIIIEDNNNTAPPEHNAVVRNSTKASVHMAPFHGHALNDRLRPNHPSSPPLPQKQKTSLPSSPTRHVHL